MTETPVDPQPKRWSLGIESRMKWLDQKPLWLKARFVVGVTMILMYLAVGDHPTGVITAYARINADLPRLLSQLLLICGALIVSRPEQEYTKWLVLPLLLFVGSAFDFIHQQILVGSNAAYTTPVAALGLFVVAWFAIQRGPDER